MKKWHQKKTKEYTGTTGELPVGESMTVPDENISVEMLLRNHTRGIPIQQNETGGEYTGDTEIPQMHDMNDLLDYKEELEQKLEQLKSKANEEIISAEEERKAIELQKKVGEEIEADPEGTE